jgi:hypothetical protein
VTKRLPPSQPLHDTLVDQALKWYLQRIPGENPWLKRLARQSPAQSVAFLTRLVEGDMPYQGRPTWLKRILSIPRDVHEVAMLGGAIAYVAQKALQWGGLVQNVSSIAVFSVAAGIVYVSKLFKDSFEMERTNSHRDWERVEAIAHLARIRDAFIRSLSVDLQVQGHRINSFFKETSHLFLQSPEVQAAANVALTDTLTSEALWREAKRRAATHEPQRPIILLDTGH